MGDPRILLAISEQELRDVDPLTRARLIMTAAERREEEAAELARRDRAEAAELRIARQAMLDRQELAATGHLQREVDAAQAQMAQDKAARVMELEAEIRRLRGAGDGGGGGWSLPTAADVDYQQHLKGQRDWNQGACMRMRQRSLQAEISRQGHQPPVHSTAGGHVQQQLFAGDYAEQEEYLPPEAVRAAQHLNGLTYQRWLSAEESASLREGDW